MNALQNTILAAMFAVIFGLIALVWKNDANQTENNGARITELEHQVIEYKSAREALENLKHD